MPFDSSTIAYESKHKLDSSDSKEAEATKATDKATTENSTNTTTTTTSSRATIDNQATEQFVITGQKQEGNPSTETPPLSTDSKATEELPKENGKVTHLETSDIPTVVSTSTNLHTIGFIEHTDSLPTSEDGISSVPSLPHAAFDEGEVLTSSENITPRGTRTTIDVRQDDDDTSPKITRLGSKRWKLCFLF